MKKPFDALCATHLLFFIPLILTAQTRYTDPNTRKMGFFSQDGRIAVPFEYDELPNWLDTLMVAKKGEFKGLINDKGRIVAPFVYHEIVQHLPPFGFKGGFAAVSQKLNTNDRNNAATRDSGPKWGMLNNKGKLVLPLEFEYVRAIDKNLLVARKFADSTLQFFDGRGNKLFTTFGRKVMPGFNEHNALPEWSFMVEQVNHKQRFMSYDGKWIFPDSIERPVWTDGKNIICIRNARAGMISKEGKILIPFEFSKLEPQGNDQFIARTPAGLHGVLRSNGSYIIPLSDKKLFNAGKGETALYYHTEGSEHSVWNSKGELISPASCRVEPLHSRHEFKKDKECRPEKYFIVVDKKTFLKGLYRSDGTQVLPVAYNEIRYATDKHPILASKTGKTPEENQSFAFNNKGQKALPEAYYTLNFSQNPKLLWGLKTYKGNLGIIDLKKPNAAAFKYQALDCNLNNGYFMAIDMNPDHVLLDPEAKFVMRSNAFNGWLSPSQDYLMQYYNTKETQGIAVAGAYVLNTSNGFWIAVNEKGKTFPIQPKWAEAKMEISDAAVMEEVMEAAPPPQEVRTQTPEDRLYDIIEVEKMPEFPGGEAAMRGFIKENLKYPAIALENNIQGRVIVRFIVEKDGKISEAQILRDIGGGCGMEALRLVNAMPKWTPGTHQGKPVRVRYTYPVIFKLD